MDKAYIEAVRLLLESAPAIFETQHFSMLQNLAKLKKSNPRKFDQQSAELRIRLLG